MAEDLLEFLVVRREFIAVEAAVLHVLGHQLRKPHFNELAGLFSILPMAIADPEIVSERAPVEVGRENEAVLVHFVGVVGDVAHPGCEGVLSYHVSLDEHVGLLLCMSLLESARGRGGS